MTQLVVAAEAETDTANILAYLAQEAGPRVAVDYRPLSHDYRTPGGHAADGAPRPRLGPNTRIAVVAPYILIYDYKRDADILTPLRILHGKRDITRLVLKQ